MADAARTDELVAFFKALSDANRLKIVALLAAGERSVEAAGRQARAHLADRVAPPGPAVGHRPRERAGRRVLQHLPPGGGRPGGHGAPPAQRRRRCPPWRPTSRLTPSTGRSSRPTWTPRDASGRSRPSARRSWPSSATSSRPSSPAGATARRKPTPCCAGSAPTRRGCGATWSTSASWTARAAAATTGPPQAAGPLTAADHRAGGFSIVSHTIDTIRSDP